MMKINCQPIINFGANYYEKDDTRYCDVEIKSIFHLRPCTEVARIALQVPNDDCILTVQGKSKEHNTKSPMSIMLANLRNGTKATITASMDFPKEIFMKIAECLEQ